MTATELQATALAASGHSVTVERIYKEGEKGFSERLHHWPTSCLQCLKNKQENTDGKQISEPQGKV